MLRRAWCAVVGCPQHNPRSPQEFTPDGQELPDWLSWSQYVTVDDGVSVTTGTVVNLPLPSGRHESRIDGDTNNNNNTLHISNYLRHSTNIHFLNNPLGIHLLNIHIPYIPIPIIHNHILNVHIPNIHIPTIITIAFLFNITAIVCATLITTPLLFGITTNRILDNEPPRQWVAVIDDLGSAEFQLIGRRNRSEEKRTAAFRGGRRFHAVPTTDPPEKPGGVGTPAAVGMGAGVGAGAAALGGAGVLTADRDGDASSQSSHGDERSSLLHGGSITGSMPRSGRGSLAGSFAGSSSGLAGVGTAMGAVGAGAAGAGLLRSLGLGRRPRTESPTHVEESEGQRNVSGNTMERMIGLVLPSRSSARKSGSGSQSHSGQRSASGATQTTDAKRSSGGTSTGAYEAVPDIPDAELFYAPRPIMDRSADTDSELYHSARSNRTASDYDEATASSRGSSSSGGHSRGSRGSKSSSSKSSRGFRGAGGRVHSTIIEEGGPHGQAFAGGDLGLPETPTSVTFSQYDSAGSSIEKSQDMGEFGARVSARGSRLALPPTSAAGRYSERNSSVGTFGTPFEQDSQASSERLTSLGGRNWVSDPNLVTGVALGAGAAAGATGAAIPWGARRQSVDSGRSPFTSLDSTRSGHRGMDTWGSPPGGTTDLPPGAVGVVPLEGGRRPSDLPLPPGAARPVTRHKRSGSTEMMLAAQLALEEYRRNGGVHHRASSADLGERTPSPSRHARNASASRALATPMGGLNRPGPGPGPIIRPMGGAVGGDMMLSPFGLGPPPPRSHGSGSNSHPSTGPSMPSAQGQSFVFPATQESEVSLPEPKRHSGTTASADGSGRRGSAPRPSSYDEFGVQQGGAGTRSEPTLVLLNSPAASIHEGRRGSYRTSGASSGGPGGWEQVGAVQALGQAWNTGATRLSMAPSRVTTATVGTRFEGTDSDDPLAPVEPVTPERARRGQFGTSARLMAWPSWLKRE